MFCKTGNWFLFWMLHIYYWQSDKKYIFLSIVIFAWILFPCFRVHWLCERDQFAVCSFGTFAAIASFFCCSLCSSVLLFWHSWHCCKLVYIPSFLSLFSCQMQWRFFPHILSYVVSTGLTSRPSTFCHVCNPAQ